MKPLTMRLLGIASYRMAPQLPSSEFHPSLFDLLLNDGSLRRNRKPLPLRF